MTFFCVYFIDTTDVQVFNAYQHFGKINFTFKVAINSSILQFMVNVSSSTGKNVCVPVLRTSDQQQLTNETMVLPVGLYYLSLFTRDASRNYVFTNITMSINLTWSNYWSPILICTPSPTLVLISLTPPLMLTLFPHSYADSPRSPHSYADSPYSPHSYAEDCIPSPPSKP